MGRTSLSKELNLRMRAVQEVGNGFDHQASLTNSQYSNIQHSRFLFPKYRNASSRDLSLSARGLNVQRGTIFQDPMCVPYDPPPLIPETFLGVLDEELEAECD